MKKIVLFILILVSLKGLSQVNDNCINLIPLCSNPSFTFFANSGSGTIVDFTSASNVSNPVNNPFPPNAGCLKQGELKPQWLLLTVGNAGLLEFVFGAGNSLNPQVGCYDWAMWPYSPTTCADILNNTLPPIRCNWNGTCNGGTGLASATTMATFNGASTQFEPPLAVNACQQFVICISNFNGINTLVSFQSLGSASLSCNPNCNPNYSVCYGSNATILPVNFAALSSPVFSIQPGNVSNTTGSFVVSPTVTTTYTTFITGTNSMNSVQTITALSTVTVFAQPAVAPTVTNTTCTNTVNAVNLNLTYSTSGGPAPSYTVNWAPIPFGLTNTSQTSFTGGIGAGSYNATISTADGCSAITNFSVSPLPDPAVIVLYPLGDSHTITCLSAVTLTAMNASYNYTWTSNVAIFNSQIVPFTSTLVGNWTLTAQNPTSGCISTKTFVVSENTLAPIGTVNPIFQTITCNANSIITVTATANLAVNVTHQFTSPQGGTLAIQQQNLTYLPGGVGVYSHCVINDVNGCSSCHNFTVNSLSTFPNYNVASPENFTLGCGSRSIATIQILNPSISTNGPLSFTLVGPGTSSIVPSSGTLSGTQSYPVTLPGTWTVITRDNTSLCDTKTAISILSNTFAPDISINAPTDFVNCYNPRVTLRGQSLTNNVSYMWQFQGVPNTLLSDTITVFSLPSSASNSIVGIYTLTIIDKNSTCQSFSLITIKQNLYPPVAIIAQSTSSISCKTPTVQFINQSHTSIPVSTGFPYQNAVSGNVWDGPSPQQQGQLSSYYIGATIGVYTLTALDLNNGCTAKATATITDNRLYPVVNKPSAPPAFVLDCGSKTRTITPYITGPTTDFSYYWTTAPGSTVTGINTPVLTTNLPGNYRLLITNTVNGCSSLSEVDVINGTLKAEFEMDPAKGFAPLPVTFFNNSSSSLGSSNITGYWNFGNGNSIISNSSNLSAINTYSLPGTYKVTLFAVKGSCMDSVSRYVQVEIPSSLEIPNVFTPNGDNVNDVFFLKTSNLENVSIYIYNRWGQIVYYSVSDDGNIQWDGKSSVGKEVADGAYFYLIKATGKDGLPYDKKGNISLFR